MRALIVTHGDLGAELIASARSITGCDARIDALSNTGHGARGLAASISQWLDAGVGPALLLVDEGRGSCGTAARMASAGHGDCWIVGGVNLPMVVTLLSRAGQLDGESLVAKVLERGAEAIRRWDGGP